MKKKQNSYDTSLVNNKLLCGVKNGWGAMLKGFKSIAHMLSRNSDDYYDCDCSSDDTDDKVTISDLIQKTSICKIVFIIYGFFAGIFIQNYCQYLCICFANFAFDHSLVSSNAMPSPLTILMDVIIIFVSYISVTVVGGCIYFIFKWLLFRNEREDEYLESLQNAFMCAMLLIVLLSIICYILPFNIFVSIHS